MGEPARGVSPHSNQFATNCCSASSSTVTRRANLSRTPERTANRRSPKAREGVMSVYRRPSIDLRGFAGHNIAVCERQQPRYRWSTAAQIVPAAS